ncbi:oxidoreductase [Vibrio hippocampi]|uniref:Oxidoreductase YdgJ n=1 Tax=Vibrio hippocampi TaxID=654686 RepID=A0ABN8DR49_9VIBR|nr:oxidoreductase [Vibrio hippocampi]CAH0529471.1 putative oxidoreductase YdgJ [Vibrio hippocampi]
MLQPIKTAIVGYGFSAKTFHIPFIHHLPEFALTAISSSQAQQVSQDWPAVTCYANAERLFEQSDCELVIITAPNDVHYSLVKAALLNNKHVIVEKPFVTDSRQGEELIELAQQQGLVLSVYHNRRWDGDFLTVKKLIEQGRLGNIKQYESHFDRFRPQVRQRWREQAEVGGGILFDLAPHLLDQSLQLFGLPEALTAQCKIMREGSNNHDYFHLVLHYPDKQVLLHADLFSAGPNRRFTIKGDQGSYEKLGLDPQESRLIQGVAPIAEDWADEVPANYGTLYTGEQQQTIATERGGYQAYFRSVAEAIRRQVPASVTAEQALWNIRLIELALESSQRQQTILVNDIG